MVRYTTERWSRSWNMIFVYVGIWRPVLYIRWSPQRGCHFTLSVYSFNKSLHRSYSCSPVKASAVKTCCAILMSSFSSTAAQAPANELQSPRVPSTTSKGNSLDRAISFPRPARLLPAARGDTYRAIITVSLHTPKYMAHANRIVGFMLPPKLISH